MAHIVATTNMKGGVGKTTLCVNLAASLAKYHNKRVLVVDLDTQISATLSLLSPQDFVKCRKDKRTLRQLITQAIQPGDKPLHTTTDVICPYVCGLKGLDLLPGDLDLYDDFMVSAVLHEMAGGMGREHFEKAWNEFERTLVANILKSVDNDYDFIILDCAPGYNLLTRSSLSASRFYVLPAKPEPLSIAGIQLLERRIQRLRESHEDTHPLNIQLLGIVFTMAGNLFTSRYYNQVMQRVHQDFNDGQIFKVQIPNDIQVSKAVDSFKPVILTNPSSGGGKAFQKLGEEFLTKLSGLLGAKEQKSGMSLADLD
jgi:chromosome partitioning protein